MADTLDSKYDHRQIEEKWYSAWEKSGIFSPKKEGSGKKDESFSIVIPPPNVTGQLHVGHALNHTIQDVLIRTARKKGKRTLWIPGTDHAGIATQNRVERNLKEEGQSRHTLGRDAFVKRIWEWKNESGGLITKQMRRLGNSVDWSRERFTMDEGLSKAVIEVFVKLFNEGLIFRGHRIINWCPSSSCTTALANDEVIHVEKEGKLYHIKYPILGSKKDFLIVATTRPETMLGDSGVAIHPKDKRYKKYQGKSVRLPLLDREIPIVADDMVDKDFGTGVVKVTPAHDPNDFETGRRHNLSEIIVMDETGKMNENAGGYQGLDRFAARKKIIEDLEALGLLDKIENHKHAVGTCYRCNQVIEPLLSDQWFVDTKTLAKEAIKAVEDGRITFHPKRYENLYFEWLNNIQDWCISRQLWWGHRIPVYTCTSCNHVFASDTTPKECPKCKKTEITQDNDVLDTWFSSALWPFSTLGWPDNTDDLKTFYPTSVLVTAYDIIFFWVARMIMIGLNVQGEVPFKDVYIHGILRNEQGQKISKSLGTNIDPIDVIDQYGADAFRFFLMATLSEGKDSVYSERRLKGYQNFANKVWNSSRFLLMNLDDSFQFNPGVDENKLQSEDSWILEKLNSTISDVERTIFQYKFHLAAEAIYAFVWNDFCDWYIEFIKSRLYDKAGPESAQTARQIGFQTLLSILGMLHPFMPFITEEIFSFLKPFMKDAPQFLASSPWPESKTTSAKIKTSAESMLHLQEVISAARAIRADAGIPPEKKAKIIVKGEDAALASVLSQNLPAVLRLAQAESVEIVPTYKAGQNDAMEAISFAEVYLPLEGLLDLEKESKKLEDEKAKLTKQIDGIDQKLKNENFLQSAPADIVEKQREKRQEASDRVEAIDQALKRLLGLSKKK